MAINKNAAETILYAAITNPSRRSFQDLNNSIANFSGTTPDEITKLKIATKENLDKQLESEYNRGPGMAPDKTPNNPSNKPRI